MWLTGLADIYTSQSPALGYMEVVHQRDAATLIHAHVAPGTDTFRPVGSIQSSFQPLDPTYPPIILSTSQ